MPNTEVPEIVPEKISVSFIPSDGSPELKLLLNGEPEVVNEVRAAEVLAREDVEIVVRLGGGSEEAVYSPVTSHMSMSQSTETTGHNFLRVALDSIVGLWARSSIFRRSF